MVIEIIFVSKEIILMISGPCTFDSTLCENEGHCINDPTMEKGFKCVCASRYGGEFCEKGEIYSSSIINSYITGIF